MNYSESETDATKGEDFSTYFMCSLGSPANLIDILSIVHKNINFDEAEIKSVRHFISQDIELTLVPYDYLKEIKLRSTREKDLYNIARLEDIRHLKNKQ